MFTTQVTHIFVIFLVTSSYARAEVVSQSEVLTEVPKLVSRILKFHPDFSEKGFALKEDSIHLSNPKNPLWIVAAILTGAEFNRDRYELHATLKKKQTRVRAKLLP